MGLFSNSFDTKLRDLEAEIHKAKTSYAEIRTELTLLKTDMANLRGNVNRKLGGKSSNPDYDDELKKDLDAFFEVMGGRPKDLSTSEE